MNVIWTALLVLTLLFPVAFNHCCLATSSRMWSKACLTHCTLTVYSKVLATLASTVLSLRTVNWAVLCRASVVWDREWSWQNQYLKNKIQIPNAIFKRFLRAPHNILTWNSPHTSQKLEYHLQTVDLQMPPCSQTGLTHQRLSLKSQGGLEEYNKLATTTYQCLFGAAWAVLHWTGFALNRVFSAWNFMQHLCCN